MSKSARDVVVLKSNFNAEILITLFNITLENILFDIIWLIEVVQGVAFTIYRCVVFIHVVNSCKLITLTSSY